MCIIIIKDTTKLQKINTILSVNIRTEKGYKALAKETGLMF
ncbi:hypothetical protein UYO_2139 [Lachnospiraceae bacterium JC7]|nr:hypothetical protein UYO_2139 [Lachnospiraceae bacterium JC7]